MKPLAAIAALEDACASIVERTFARVFPSDVAPAQIARKLVAVMESNPVPTYLVRLHPRDIAGLGRRRAQLEGEWSEMLARTARTLGLPPARRVVVHADESMVAGTVAVDAIADDEEAEAPHGYAVRIVRGLPLDAAFPVVGTVTIGRGPDNAVDLVDLRASRKHASLALEGDPVPQVTIEDLGSTNGTFVNGKRIGAKTRIQPGDEIVVGDTALRLEFG